MLTKLIKYDFKWINKIMYVYFLILFLITISIKIVQSLKQTFLIMILNNILTSIFIACIVSVIINCIMRIWVRFIHNIYKDESYLTHTLPVTKNELFNSKIISSLLSILLSVTFILLCAAIVALDKNILTTINNTLNSLTIAYGKKYTIIIVISIAMVVLLELIYIMLTGIFAIVKGYSKNNYKLVKTIMIGICSYMTLSIISLLIFKIIINVGQLEDMPTLNTLKTLIILSITIYTTYNILYYFIAKHLLNRGVNVE